MSRESQRQPTGEENALFAVMEGDTEAALEILEDSFPSELHQLIEWADRLSELADQVLRTKGAR